MSNGTRPDQRRGTRLSYPYESDDGIRIIEVPVVIGVIGDFGIEPVNGRRPLPMRRFQLLDVDVLPPLAAAFGPEAAIHRLAPLVELTAAHPWMRIRVLDASKAELAADLSGASTLDESVLWKKMFDAELGSFAGEPYAMMLLDFPFTADKADVELLQSLAMIGARVSCPFIATAAPRCFAVDRWDALDDPERLDALFATRPYAAWHALRDRDEARFVALTAYGSALGTGATLMRSYLSTGLWTDDGTPDATSSRPHSSQALDDALARHGFLVGHASLRDARTVQRARRYHQPLATAHGELMARLAHVMTSSQFLRAAACVARDTLMYSSRADLQVKLNRWIRDYVDDGREPGLPDRMLRPLAEATVEIKDVIGAPGEVETVLNLRIDLPDVQSERCARCAMRTLRFF